MITETRFPLLEWTGYALGEQPEHIPIAALNQSGADFMAGSKVFQALIVLFDTDRYAGNTVYEKVLEKKPRPAGFFPARNLYLTPKVAQQLDSDEAFRNRLWQSVSRTPTVSGTIFWGKGFQYAYRILSVEDSSSLMGMGYIPPDLFVPGARLIIVGVFIEDTMFGFEFGFIAGNGTIHVCAQDSFYPQGMDKGMYISFTLLTLLSWLRNEYPQKELKAGEGINQSRQPVTVLSHR